ncbi:2-dehydro-3-deoxygluconokinase [compost metagenome]
MYLTGITPVLSPFCRESVFHAIEVALKHRVTVVFDPYLRRKLWSEEEARYVLSAIVRKADMILAGAGEGDFLYGTKDCAELA